MPEETKSRAVEIASETAPRPHSRTSRMTLRMPCFSASKRRLRISSARPLSSEGMRNTRMSGSTFCPIIFGADNFSRTRSTSSGVALPRRITPTLMPVPAWPLRRLIACPTDMSRVVNPLMDSKISPLRIPAFVPGLSGSTESTMM